MNGFSNGIEINPLNWEIQQISSGVRAIAIDPITDIISYAFPWIKASLDRHVRITKENSSGILMGEAVVDSLQKEISSLATAAGIKGKVSPYTSLNAPFSGYQGLQGKIVTLPLEYIHAKVLDNVEKNEQLLTKEELEKSKAFSDNELRYLMSTGIAELTIFPLLKVIARITILALMVGLIFTPLSLYSSGVTFAVGTLLYIAIDRFIGNRVDKCAHKILTNRFKEADMPPNLASRQSAIAGINALRKIQLQRVDLRNKGGWIAKLLINSAGDMRFDFTTPSFKKRIQTLQEIQELSSKRAALGHKKLKLSTP